MNTINIEEYISKSILCNWKITKHTPPNNYNIISVCYFRQLNTSDEDNQKYIKGIINLAKSFSKILRDYRLRIYHDESTKDIINKNIKLSNNIELYCYDIPIFKEDSIYHKKLLGTMIRFLPLYDYKLHKVDECIIFDIDNKIYHGYNKMIKLFRQNKTKIAYRSRACYIIKKRITCLHSNKLMYPVIASFIYQSISLPTKSFRHFLEKLYISNDSKLNNLITKCSLDDKYSYGIDEIYINKYHMRYFYKNKIPILLVLFNHYNFYQGLIHYLEYIDDDKLMSYYNYIKDLLNMMNINIDINNKSKKNIESELEKHSDIITKYLSTCLLEKLKPID